MFWKDLSKKEKYHLKEQEITTLRDFKVLANLHVKMRLNYPNTEPCFICKEIARKLELL